MLCSSFMFFACKNDDFTTNASPKDDTTIECNAENEGLLKENPDLPGDTLVCHLGEWGRQKKNACSGKTLRECLIGSWDFIGIADSSTGNLIPKYDYSRNPGKMIFKKDSLFEFSRSSIEPDPYGIKEECNQANGKVMGNWTVENGKLKMVAIINAECLQGGREKEFKPKFVIENDLIKMTMGPLWLAESDVDEFLTHSIGREIYTIRSR